jgi:DNA-binding PadR family transcriptional regulator
MSDSIRLTAQTVAVIKAVLKRHGKGVSGAEIAKDTRLASGSLYPILTRLEKAGWLSSEWETGNPAVLGRPRRRFYRVTALGQREVNVVRNALAPDMGGVAWSAT